MIRPILTPPLDTSGPIGRAVQHIQQFIKTLFDLQTWGRGFIFSLSYGWLVVFCLIPFAIILKISFSEVMVGTPPYTQIFEWPKEYLLNIRLNFSNYLFLLKDSLYISALLCSLSTAALSTILCLLIGYPMAYAIARAPNQYRVFLLMLVILPFWTSFLIRIYAWMGILSHHGLINNILIWLGVIDQPLVLLSHPLTVCSGIVYAYLPFMVLPLYATLAKIDMAYLEAAYDLGCRPFRAFLSVILPLSMPGILSGSVLVFIPAVGEYVIPELLGGPDALMIGRVMWSEFFNNHDWPVAAALAVVLCIILVFPVMLLQSWQMRQEEADAL
jgi:putrescine transport system permease protein